MGRSNLPGTTNATMLSCTVTITGFEPDLIGCLGWLATEPVGLQRHLRDTVGHDHDHLARVFVELRVVCAVAEHAPALDERWAGPAPKEIRDPVTGHREDMQRDGGRSGDPLPADPNLRGSRRLSAAVGGRNGTT